MQSVTTNSRMWRYKIYDGREHSNKPWEEKLDKIFYCIKFLKEIMILSCSIKWKFSLELKIKTRRSKKKIIQKDFFSNFWNYLENKKFSSTELFQNLRRKKLIFLSCSKFNNPISLKFWDERKILKFYIFDKNTVILT